MLILSDNDISKLISMDETIETVENAFIEYSKGNVILPPRSTIMIPEFKGSISFMPSYLTKIGAQATKIISIYPENKKKGLSTTVAWLIVNDPETGMIKAFLDASFITAMRTGAITGVAAKYLAPRESHILAIFGAGVQGRTQTIAACSVRDIEKIYIYDLFKEARNKFALEMTEKLGIPVISVDDGKSAVKDADIVLTATTSSKPVFNRRWIKEKVHISAIGAFYPNWREIDTQTIVESKLYVDDYESIMKEAGDILIPIKEGAITEEHIYAELKDLVSGNKEGRTLEDKITVFKSVGIAIQDSSVANLVLKKLGV
jgi:ornithine cyclodeaminase/alanine dehydrogenase